MAFHPDVAFFPGQFLGTTCTEQFKHSELDAKLLLHKLLPLGITRQLGVNPSSDGARGRMGEDADVT